MRLAGFVTLLLVLATWTHSADTEGFRELDEQRNFKNMYTQSSGSGGGGALGNLQTSSPFSSTTEMPTLIGSDLTQMSDEKSGLEAIRALHKQLDDDANGNVDLLESDEFLREELKYEDGHERRQRAFHRNDDMHISVKELWEAWTRSEVHNWTTEQTNDWLIQSVELPQYASCFSMNSVKGSDLPKLATNNQFISTVLKIKDPIHIKKISLKAMDVVLFGPPKADGGHVKDIILLTLLVGACGACWYAYRQKILSQEDLQRMMKDMESLHLAEQKLYETQKELEVAKTQQETVVTEKENLEKKLKEHKAAPVTQTTKGSESELQMRQELESLRLELKRAESELEDRCWSPPIGLQQWLQLTHEIENKAYMKKKSSAERQLQQAREACEKLKKKRSSLVGAFVSTHGKSIDDVDRSIVEARTSLNEVTQELQERVHRWKQIEMLCGFNIISNNGLSYLETILYRSTNGRLVRGRMSSQDDLDEDSVSQASPGGFLDPWRDADSSGSERDLDPSTSPSMELPVQFSMGGDIRSPTDELCDGPLAALPPSGHIEKRMSLMSRSASQDAGEVLVPKGFLSEANLDARGVARACGSLEEETYSTDSSASATATDEDMKRKRRKLHFPTFVRKSKSKPS